MKKLGQKLCESTKVETYPTDQMIFYFKYLDKKLPKKIINP